MLSDFLVILFVELVLFLLFLVFLFSFKPKKKLKKKPMPHKCCGKCKFNIENIPKEDEFFAFRKLFSENTTIGGKGK